ncbi:hypothetical protein EMCRGX_G030780 [Ephydatia muelleri]
MSARMEGFGEDMLIAKWDANLEKVRTIGEKLASTPPHPSNEHICRSGVAVISGGTTAFSILTLSTGPDQSETTQLSHSLQIEFRHGVMMQQSSAAGLLNYQLGIRTAAGHVLLFSGPHPLPIYT